MNESEIRAGMGVDFDLPPVLAALLAYAESHRGEVACDLELTGEGETLSEGILRDETLAKSFAVFAHDGMLGLYALWLIDGTPVVYLASDWVETGVLAGTLDEFAALLTLGRERIGMLEDWPSQGECAGIDEFREWATQALGVEPLTEAGARDLVNRARESYPDLKTWIDERRTEPAE